MDCALPLALLLSTTQPACAPALPVAVHAPATSAISKEPFYRDLVVRAHRLKVQTEAFAAKPSLNLLQSAKFKTYTTAIRALSAGDQQGHIDLKARGTDSDLKCILKGVSLDLNIKMDALLAAKDDASFKTALGNMDGLLSDNIDVIVTPATTNSGLDCVIEFGNT